jgi:hypothetical protein
MHFKFQDFNAWLGNIGESVTWRQAFACPCVSPHSGAAQVNCPNCGGKGRFWPGAGQQCVLGAAGQHAQQQWRNSGRFESGDVVMTIGSDQSAYTIGAFDRVLMLNGVEQFSIVKVRGLDETLLFTPQAITRAFWLDNQAPNPQATPESWNGQYGYLMPTQSSRINDVSYTSATAANVVNATALPTVDATNTLQWPTSGGPPAGTQYTLNGTRYREYFVYDDLPQTRNMHQGMPLPRRVVLRRFDLFGR